MNNEERAQHGRRAIEVGTPDFGQNADTHDALGVTTDGGDTIANVLHAIHIDGGDPEHALASAVENYEAELADDEEER